MDTPSDAFLPCDLPQWKEIKVLLKEATKTKSTDYVIHVLQKVQDVVHCKPSRDDLLGSAIDARPKTENVFTGLKVFLDNKATREEYDDFFDNILPDVIQRAINIEYFPEYLRHKRTSKNLEIKRRLAASAVACAFLRIFPFCADGRYVNSNLNVRELYEQRSSDSSYSYLRSILQYLSAMARQTDGPSGSIYFTRQKLCGQMSTNEVFTRDKILCPITVHSGHLVHQHDQLFSQIFIGMGAFGDGMFSESQEARIGQTFPELIVGRVFIAPIEINELVMVQSSEPLYGSISTTAYMSFIDTSLALVKQSYCFEDVLREISCLECTIRQQVIDSCRRNVEEQVTCKRALFETCDTDLPCDSSGNSVSSNHLPTVASHTRKAALSSLRTKNWRSSSSVGSFSVSVSRAQSIDLETSSTSSTGDDSAPGSSAQSRRRSAAMHSSMSVSSRRGSALQGQSSVNSEGSLAEFGLYSRRRSSGLSDVSLRSSSSSGKRSSTDFSSEFEEYFDNLQQHRSLAAAVIEEENGGLLDAIVAHMDTISEDLGREAPDVEEKINVSPWSQLNTDHLPPDHSLLEHFVDNLINEAAQDSRFELENYLSRQHPQAEHSLELDARVVRDGELRDKIDSRALKATDDSKTFRHLKPSKESEGDLNYAAYADEITRSILLSALEIVSGDSLSTNQLQSITSYISSSSFNTCEECCHNFVADSFYVEEYAAFLSRSICHEAFDTYRDLINKNLVSPVRNEVIRSHANQTLMSSENSLFRPPNSRRFHLAGHSGNSLIVGNWQRVSLSNEMLHTQRQNASHFKDTVLSEFEDQLVRSNASSPCLLLFADSRRRSSEPAISSYCTGRRRNRQLASSSFCDSTDLQHRSLGTLHSEFISSLFEADATGHSTCNGNAATGLECYAQNLVLGAFSGALMDISQLLRSPCNHVSYSATTDLMKLSQCIVDQAFLEATEIMAVSSSVAQHSGSDSDTELHLLATNFTERVISEAAEVYTWKPVLRPIASGVSGPWCVFAENQQLLAVIEWIAMSLACIPHFHLYTNGSTDLIEMNRVLNVVNERRLTTSSLINELQQWFTVNQDSPGHAINLFDFLILRLT